MPSTEVVTPSRDETAAAEAAEATFHSRPHSRQFALQLFLLIATFLTTTLIGMRYMRDFNNGLSPLTSSTDLLPYSWAWNHLEGFAAGLPFSLSLLAILLAHELGHYTACRSYGIEATLPFVLPAPTLSGTFGAVIRIRSRVQSRTALMVIGASGPIAGFCVAVVTTCYGLLKSKTASGLVQSNASLIRIGAPGLIPALHSVLIAIGFGVPPLLHIIPHPVLLASWIGLIVTSINLIPAGQLDGGHILYALSPRAHRIVNRLSISLLLYFGVVEWVGWLIWALLLVLPVMRHAKIIDERPLDIRIIALAPVCLFIFALTVSIQPCTEMSLIDILLRIYSGLGIR